MKRIFLSFVLFCAIALGAFQIFAQMAEPKESLITIYNVAPGKHLEFLNFMAKGEAINKELGLPASQWYVHENGGSWDYLSVNPVLTKEQQDKVDAMSKQKGLPIGMKGSLQFRMFINSHTDTFAIGPTTVAEILKAAE
jgi:hypothetical protein